MKEITIQEMETRASMPEVWDSVIRIITLKLIEDKASITHIALARNRMMDSSSFGDTSLIVIGPGCACETPEDCEGRWLNDLPSERQYFVEYAPLHLNEN